MPLQIQMGENKIVVMLSGEMTIYTADEIKSAISPLLFQPLELELNLAEVTDIDTAGLQILLAAKKTALSGGLSLHLVWHSQAVLNILELCQVSAFFGDPTLIPHSERV